MNVLFIGGTGVLSSAVTTEAIKQGFCVTMVNRGNRMSRIPQGVELIKADKYDHTTIAKGLRGRQFDAVMDYLCYSIPDIEKSFNFYSKYTKQYFFISSCAVYDTRMGGMCNEESPKVLPVWDYSVRKWKSEEHLMALAKKSTTKVTIIRPGVTYDDTRIPYGISPLYGYHWTLAARILSGKPIITWNEGRNRCNMTRVEDFAIGVVGLIGNPKAYGEAFNLCGDETPSFDEVLDILSEFLGKEAIRVDVSPEFYAAELPMRRGEILGGRSIDAINSNEKLRAAVPEFKQSISIKDGIVKTLNAYKHQKYQRGIDWNFDGDTDRIISKWCRENGIDSSSYKLHFVDYLNNAMPSDYRLYLRARYINKLYYNLRKIVSFIKRNVLNRT
jgi:nucleoside-diphosphate-sugar epimerase